MRILTVNRGSSSLKLAVVEDDDSVSASDDSEDLGGLASFVESCGPIDCAAHRVVHGGDLYAGPVVLQGSVEDHLAALSDLAPLHNGPSLEAIEASQRLLPSVPQVACFDTAFHATMPPAAATYAVPEDWRSRFAIRRYGFHGLSHGYCARRVGEVLDAPPLRIITAHIGAGASLAAVVDGRSVDTTMGFTPLEGLVMATRSGTVDPGLVLWLQRDGGLGADEVLDGLEHRSGLLGLGGSADLREVIDRMDEGDERCRLAYQVYVHRLRREFGAMAATARGLDVVAFTGGAGEASSRLRADVAWGLSFLGVALDERANATADVHHSDHDVRVISSEASEVWVFVVEAREDLEMARQVRQLLS